MRCMAPAGTTPPAPPALRYGGTAIYVDEVPAALDFYRRAFGLDKTLGGGWERHDMPPAVAAN